MEAAIPVTLQEAADQLGVHYQTVYRWVRQGALPAVKVSGSYVIDPEALGRFAENRTRPEPPPARVAVRDWSVPAGRLHAALLVGDEALVRDIFDHLRGGGMDLATICDLALSPALVRIGEAWMAGQLSVAEEHRASAMCERQLGRLTPSPPGRPRGICVVCSPPTDEHHLAGAMATAVLREDHWRVHHLGTGVPVEHVVALIDTEKADLVVISVTWPPARPDAAAMAERLAQPNRRVLVGQPGQTLADLVAAARGD